MSNPNEIDIVNLSSYIEDDDINKIKRSNLIYDRDDMDYYEKFPRFGCNDPFNNFDGSKEYVFFTKPDLHLYDGSGTLNKEIASYPFFKDCHLRYYNVMRSLQSSYNDTTDTPFLNILSGKKQNNLDLPSITAEDGETSATIYGASMSYMRNSEKSDDHHEFSMEFKDTRYTEIYMMFKIWDEYTRLKDLGVITPPSRRYIENKELHDQISWYKFIVDDDGESIIFFAKGWGVFPKNVPREVFSSLTDDENYSINFHTTFVEDMNPLIISEFNNLVINKLRRQSKDLPLYDSSIGRISGEWANIPYVQLYHTNNEMAKYDRAPRYKLKWR